MSFGALELMFVPVPVLLLLPTLSIGRKLKTSRSYVYMAPVSAVSRFVLKMRLFLAIATGSV